MFGTKKKLMAAVVMLVISAIMMTSASYAWFTISTNPEITNLTAQVVVNENLEIALATSGSLPTNPGEGDTGKQDKWGNVIDIDETALTEPITLLPATLIEEGESAQFKYPTYGVDGRVDKILPLNETSNTDGFGRLADKVTAEGALDTGATVYGYYVDFWVRSNMGGKLKLSEAKDRNTGGIKGTGSCYISGGTTEQDKIYAEHVSVAFKDITTEIKDGDKVLAGPTKAGVYANPRVSDNKTATVIETDVDYSAYVGRYLSLIENEDIVELVANQAKLIRMYVYFEGKDLLNENALLGTALEGVLNVQFELAGVDSSMPLVKTPTEE